MLRFPVSPSKAEDLRRRMGVLGVTEGEFQERFFAPSGRGPRKRRAQVGVSLRHDPTGVEVTCQKSTRQSLNRFLARRHLVGILERRVGAREVEDGRAGVGETVRAMPGGGRPGRPGVAGETSVQHMQRMFARSFERDIAQPYPLSAQRLLGVGELPTRLIGILGDRERGPAGPPSGGKRTRTGAGG